MGWTGDGSVRLGVCERAFSLRVDGDDVPGIAWYPEGGGDGRGDGRLVMLGHGGHGHKRTGYILSTARRLVREHGIGAFAIDAPGYGDRPRAGSGRDFEHAWAASSATDEIVRDFTETLAWVRSELGPGPVGYWGLSMGTMMGLPTVAALPDVVVAAVFGLMGYWGPNKDRLREDAPKVCCPVRFLVQWDDEIIERDLAMRLFDEIGSKEKALHAHPGKHDAVPPEAMRASTDFLASKLGS